MMGGKDRNFIAGKSPSEAYILAYAERRRKEGEAWAKVCSDARKAADAYEKAGAPHRYNPGYCQGTFDYSKVVRQAFEDGYKHGYDTAKPRPE